MATTRNLRHRSNDSNQHRKRINSFVTVCAFLSIAAFLFELSTSFKTSALLGVYNSDFPAFSETRAPGRSGYQRVVYLQGDSRKTTNSERSVEPLGGPCSYCERNPFDYIRDVERPYYEECTLMADWQSAYYPTCLSLHELHIAGDDENFALVSLHGNWRSVWRYHNNNETVAVKLLQLSHEFDHESLNYHRIDAMVMERLTSSPHIVDVFQFCGESVITEWATGSAREHIKDERWRSRERLELGLNIARALLDLHSIDYPNSTNATLAHNDINMANAIEVNGQIKLNDFNIAQVLKWNKTKPCGSPVRFQAPFWKSPEENAEAHSHEVRYVDATKTDVYGLGNLLFQVLTKRQPWTHLEPNGTLTAEEVKSRKEQGKSACCHILVRVANASHKSHTHRVVKFVRLAAIDARKIFKFYQTCESSIVLCYCGVLPLQSKRPPNRLSTGQGTGKSSRLGSTRRKSETRSF